MEKTGDALIGYTGFVGSNILAQRPFDLLYNSKNIEEIQNKNFDLVVCAGAPGIKWIANKNPGLDMDSINNLISNLKAVKCKKLVLISTIDIYPQPLTGYNEDSTVDNSKLTAYGRHRHLLEQFIQDTFDSLIIRLPAIYGQGLKKNVIFDLLNNVPVTLNPHSKLQFYWLNYIWSDIQKALSNNLKSLNLATEPIELNYLAKEVFGLALLGDGGGKPPAHYDMHTKYGKLWGTNQPYLYLRDKILEDLKVFKKTAPP
jgi:nucleoside-diphosphate-sugar epimerase